jgi:hypothetical protein
MADTSKPSDRSTAGRSADARGETGTDADTLAPRAGSATGDTRMGGIPSTADSSLSPSMSGSSDLGSDGPVDRERPARDDGNMPPDRKRAGAKRDDVERPSSAPEHIDGPLESLGKAVSAPVRGAADPDADEKPR